MTARIAFYFVAVVALVLFLAAAVPSHATQHRDPALTTPEMVQKPQNVAPSHTPDVPAAKPRSSAKNSASNHNQAKAKNSSKKLSAAQDKASEGSNPAGTK